MSYGNATLAVQFSPVPTMHCTKLQRSDHWEVGECDRKWRTPWCHWEWEDWQELTHNYVTGSWVSVTGSDVSIHHGDCTLNIVIWALDGSWRNFHSFRLYFVVVTIALCTFTITLFFYEHPYDFSWYYECNSSSYQISPYEDSTFQCVSLRKKYNLSEHPD